VRVLKQILSYRRETVLQGGSLEEAYAVHLKLIRKLVEDLLLAIIELFSLGVTAEVLRANIDRKSAFLLGVHGSTWPKL